MGRGVRGARAHCCAGSARARATGHTRRHQRPRNGELTALGLALARRDASSLGLGERRLRCLYAAILCAGECRLGVEEALVVGAAAAAWGAGLGWGVVCRGACALLRRQRPRASPARLAPAQPLACYARARAPARPHSPRCAAAALAAAASDRGSSPALTRRAL